MSLKESLKLPRITILFSSLFILLLLGLQLYAAKHLRDFWPKFRRLQSAHKLLKPPSDPALWPFMSYPMYSYPKYAGNAIKQYEIIGTLADGSEVAIMPEDLGINYWIYMYAFKEAMRKKKYQDIKSFVELYETKHQQKLVSIRLEYTPLILSKKDVTSEQKEIVTDIKIEELEEKY